MTYRFGDSFDKYGAFSQLARSNWLVAGVSGALVTGRFGGSAAQLGGNTTLQHIFGANLPTFIVGFAFKRTVTSVIESRLVGVFDLATEQVFINFKIDGRLEIKRGATVLALSTFVVPFNAFVHIEVKFTIDNAAGAVEVRANGVTTPILSVAGVDTASTANNYATSVMLHQFNTVVFDDFFVLDTAGAENNNFIGDVRFKTQFATGAGVTSAFGVVGAGANFDAVNDAVPGDDTKYVFSSNPTDRDTYEMSDVGPTDIIKVVQISHLARKTDAGARTLVPVLISGATTVVDPGVGLGETYGYIHTPKPLDPNTGLPWTPTGINDAKIGQEVA